MKNLLILFSVLILLSGCTNYRELKGSFPDSDKQCVEETFKGIDLNKSIQNDVIYVIIQNSIYHCEVLKELQELKRIKSGK